MRHLLRHSIIIIAVILCAIAAIYPPDKKLSLGKDLAGGTTLVYQVELRPQDGTDTVDRIIDVLRKRVNPNGLLDIKMVRQGSSRIEITMPLPNDRVKKLRADYEAALAQLSQGAVTPEQFDLVMLEPDNERPASLQRLAAGNPHRLELLEAAASAYKAQADARNVYAPQRAQLDKAVADAEAALAAVPAPAKDAPPDPRRAPLQAALDSAIAARDAAAGKVAAATNAYEAARQAALNTAISDTEVRRIFELSDEGRVIQGADGKNEKIDSPRKQALDRLRAAHPDAAAEFDKVVAAWNAYNAERKTLDDPSDLVRILRGAGVLEFRIVARPKDIPDAARFRQELHTSGPTGGKSSATVRWVKLNNDENYAHSRAELNALRADPIAYFQGRYDVIADRYDGETYILCYDIPGKRLTQAEGNWSVASAAPGRDESGAPDIQFVMDAVGANKMGDLTAPNIHQPMAVILDDQIYTFPTLQAAISGSGRITGDFTLDEINYIVRVLGSGSLSAKLSPEPISITTIGPDLGADNLKKGLQAGALAFFLVSMFMIVYYFGNGLVAVCALLVNALLVLALMAIGGAAFSLPGIAGVILTFGMAVDANVLIYERMREEIQHGNDLRTAMRLAYSRALSAILDGNATNFIVCLVLVWIGTQEIKGFGITMIIGVITTLFCQLYLTRFIYTLLIDKAHVKRLSMLPMAFPRFQRLITPNIDWMKYRPAFVTFSLLLTTTCVAITAYRGRDLLNTEFRGGTTATVQLKDGQKMDRPEIEKRLTDYVHAHLTPSNRDLLDAQVSPVDPEAGGVRANRFTIKTSVEDRDVVSDTISSALVGLLDQQPAVTFKGSQTADASAAPVRVISQPNLGDDIGRPEIQRDVKDFVGGAAVVLEDMSPPISQAQLEERLRAMRSDQQFASTSALSRAWRVVPLKATPDGKLASAVVIVHDPVISALTDNQKWNAQVRDVEWQIVRAALSRASTLTGLESFSAAIAKTFVAQAAVAILISTLLIIIYLWVRFNSFRYSIAAALATLHDCVVATGAIASAELICNAFPGFASSIGLLPFKVDLNVVAAVLTILGYSLNDTIIVMDRIRENRGKAPVATRAVVDLSINQTISRTIITSGTTTIATLVLYCFAGEAVRPFAFCFLVGVVTGTYSSVGVAAPIVWSKKADPTDAAGNTLPASGHHATSTNGTLAASRV